MGRNNTRRMCQDKLQMLLKLIVRCHVGGAYVPGKCCSITQFSLPLHSYFLPCIDFFLKSVKVILQVQSKEILLVMTFVAAHCYQRRIDSHCYCLCTSCDLSHDACDVTYPPVNRLTPVKTLPSCDYCGW